MTTFLEPTTVDEACAALAADVWGAKAIAGGTALVLMIRQGLVAPAVLVSLGRIGGMRGFDLTPDRLWIGARTTLAEIGRSTEVETVAPNLALACRQVGNVRVRNVATIGGNLAEADYASDPPSVLVSLEAVCTVTGPNRSRLVPAAELITGFFTTTLQPGEIITGVVIPRFPQADIRYAYQKYVSRSSEDRPCVGVAAVAEFERGVVKDLRVVVGAVAAVPQRFDLITQEALATDLGPDLRRRIAAGYAAAVDPLEDVRGSAWYRRRMIEVFVGRALESLVVR